MDKVHIDYIHNLLKCFTQNKTEDFLHFYDYNKLNKFLNEYR